MTSARSWKLPCRRAMRKSIHEPRLHTPGKQEPIDPVLHPPSRPLPSPSSSGSRPPSCGKSTRPPTVSLWHFLQLHGEVSSHPCQPGLNQLQWPLVGRRHAQNNLTLLYKINHQLVAIHVVTQMYIDGG